MLSAEIFTKLSYNSNKSTTMLMYLKKNLDKWKTV